MRKGTPEPLVPVCFDLFGHERSRGAGNAYQWGLKGRFNKEDAGALNDPQSVNQGARELYYTEVQGLIALLNKDVSEEQPKLYVPDIKFRRGIGDYKGKPFSVNGAALDEEGLRPPLAGGPSDPKRQRRTAEDYPGGGLDRGKLRSDTRSKPRRAEPNIYWRYYLCLKLF